ncbi:CAP domain-containing protein [Methylobacterium durans]|uniref:CAP domain-containing protein n=1 Tax=Methylobacterium durans TaxID=2202825 RepID=UPI002AFFA9BD|nr:CAP domain-containing protein [Methylobacterium durans]MEA1833889.1 CAP domain-containing protein [Methylobacterium durans]
MLVVALCIALWTCPSARGEPGQPDPAEGPATGPNGNEQYMLELVNRERILAGVQPLSWNTQLARAARAHCAWMIAHQTFSHDENGASLIDQLNRGGLVWRAGPYEFQQNIAWGNVLKSIPDEILRHHVGYLASPDHRVALLNAAHQEVGIGLVEGQFRGMAALLTTENFGSNNATPFLTGAAYADSNGNGRYDPGEGRPQVEVRIRDRDGRTRSVSTADGGGYSVNLAPGTYRVSLSTEQPSAAPRVVRIDRANVKLDFVEPAGGSGEKRDDRTSRNDH